MARAKSILQSFSLALVFLPVLSAACQDSGLLPDAPAPDRGVVPEHASNTQNIAPSKWYGVVDPGERVPPLNARDKMEFWLHEEFSPVSLLPAFISAGYGQLTLTDPKYGSDSGAFGERLGAAALRQASMRFLSDSLLPTLTHSDPRYYREAYGGFKARSGYALERVFIDQKDSGAHGFNFSGVMGRLMASSLTVAYYPQQSANAEVVFRTWGTSLAGEAVNNMFLEFWPDIRDAVFHRHEH